MMLGPFENVTERQKPLFLNPDPPNYVNEYKTYQRIFKICWEIAKSQKSGISEKTGTEHPEDPPYQFLKILNTGPISSRKHELGTL